jgi:DivIVA domain-containing protein
MDRNDIERIRVQGFTEARRGYDRREVDKFLTALTEWLDTDAAKDLGGVAVKRKLELAGKSTAHILLTAEQEADDMRLQIDEECAQLRSQAETASLEAKRAADEYAEKVREKADDEARKTGEAASAKAKRAIDEGARLRAQIDAVIGELDTRRVDTLRELERLHGELASTIEKHAFDKSSNQRNGGEKGKSPQGSKEPEAAGKP